MTAQGTFQQTSYHRNKYQFPLFLLKVCGKYMGNNSTKQSFYESVNDCENVCRVSASHPLPPYAFLREDVVFLLFFFLVVVVF